MAPEPAAGEMDREREGSHLNQTERGGGPVITPLSHQQPPGKPTRVHPHRQQPATNHNNHNNNPKRQPPTTTPMTTRIKPHRPPYLGHDKVPVGVLEPDLGAGRRQVRKPPLTPHAGRRGIRTASPAPCHRRPHEVSLPEHMNLRVGNESQKSPPFCAFSAAACPLQPVLPQISIPPSLYPTNKTANAPRTHDPIRTFSGGDPKTSA